MFQLLHRWNGITCNLILKLEVAMFLNTVSIVCCGAVLPAILAIAWLLVIHKSKEFVYVPWFEESVALRLTNQQGLSYPPAQLFRNKLEITNIISSVEWQRCITAFMHFWRFFCAEKCQQFIGESENGLLANPGRVIAIQSLCMLWFGTFRVLVILVC